MPCTQPECGEVSRLLPNEILISQLGDLSIHYCRACDKRIAQPMTRQRLILLGRKSVRRATDLGALLPGDEREIRKVHDDLADLPPLPVEDIMEIDALRTRSPAEAASMTYFLKKLFPDGDLTAGDIVGIWERIDDSRAANKHAHGDETDKS